MPGADRVGERMTERVDLRASFAVLLSGAAWGLFWLPLRWLESVGITGAWASLGFFLAALPVILPLLIWRRRAFVEGGLRLAVTGAVTGVAFLCYALSLLLTEVVRALLLFYLTPLWGTLLAWMLLGERLTRGRVAALLLAAGGLLAILGLEGRAPAAPYARIGDLLGLLSGALWAYGALRIYREPHGGALEQGVGFFAWAALAALPILWLLPAGASGPPPTAETLLAAAPLTVVLAGLVYLPAISLIFWAAAHLDPGRVGMLMMSEIVVGIASAAALTDEPFGLREATGTTLILAAALVEVATARPAPARE